ncbi:RNA polymerase sigma factor [Streptomyces tsukubensis]|uniref:RNA polymerase sigma factor n=1 Tax=Streptomyces tsukubensis TaxID=83656 RepID=UPI0036ACA29A
MKKIASADPGILPPPLEPDTTGQPGRDAAEVLHDSQYPALVRFLLLQGATWSEAQDAAQTAFMHLCRPGLTVAHPKAWLRTTAFRSWVRQQVPLEDPEAPIPDRLHWNTPDHAMELNAQHRQVIGLLMRLPTKQRAALAWQMDGFTTEETAREMKTTPAAVRQNLACARAALKKALRLEEEDNAEDTPGRNR